MQKTGVFSDFYCLLNKLAFMGLTSWAKFSRPCGTECKFTVLTQTLKPSSARPVTARLKPCPSSVDVTRYLSRNYNFGVESYIDPSFTCYRLRFSIGTG
jgi:hypothetical protein